MTLIPGLFWGGRPFIQILFVLFWGHLDRKKSLLDPALRALIQVRVAQINWCEFCIDYNSLNLLKRTNSLDKVEQLKEWQTSSIFTEQEKITLEYVEVISNITIKISKSLTLHLLFPHKGYVSYRKKYIT